MAQRPAPSGSDPPATFVVYVAQDVVRVFRVYRYMEAYVCIIDGEILEFKSLEGLILR